MMVTNGKFNRRYRLCPLTGCFLFLYCLIAGLSLCGCRSTRNTVEEARGEIHTTVAENNTATTDTLHTATTAHEEQTDTAEVRADQHSTIKIQRDSVGRIIEIVAKRSGKVSANTKHHTERDRWFYGLNATRHSEASGSVDSFAQTKKEEKKDYKFGPSLETGVGLTILAVVILLYIGDYIVRLWRKKKGK